MRPELTMSAWLRFGAIRRGLAIAQPKTLLEVGAGEGALGAWLANQLQYVGVEPDDTSREVAVHRLRTLGRGEMRASLPSAGDRYDLVCAFEVLEHIADDASAVREWRDRLQPHGHLLISVPAHARRYGVSDRFVGHVRRYDRPALHRLLEANGFAIVRSHSYGAGLGLALDGVRNLLLRRRSASSGPAAGTALSGRLFQPRSGRRALANYLVALPFRVLQAPFAATDIGIGYVVLARRAEALT